MQTVGLIIIRLLRKKIFCRLVDYLCTYYLYYENTSTYSFSLIDYRFWDDPADEFKEDVGTLLPLWKFSYEKAKKMTVTDIRCSHWYYDLFGVSFGSCKYILIILRKQQGISIIQGILKSCCLKRYQIKNYS